MFELMRTNDLVAISFATALLKDAEILYQVTDENMSVLEGSLGVLPRRLLVDVDCIRQAVRILTDADLAEFIAPRALEM